ncbi:MAG: double-strand break repair helicase AddA [Albidovulum sp.]
MIRNDASEAQVRAANPIQSVWLSANAGSGKTRVLIDRVARLLLGGTEPQRILCLTYTKAAASEMQNRLFDRLGHWAMLPEPQLRHALEDLGVDGAIDAQTLAKARRLFARAIETPGGLKIQTIHSFCAALLRRFPLEARVSPNFTEMDDRAAKLLRQEIVEELAAGDDIPAFDGIAALGSGDDLSGFLSTLCRHSDGFSDELTAEDALALFGLPPGYSVASLLGEVFQGGEAELIAELVPLLLASGPNDVKEGVKLAPLDLLSPSAAHVPVLESAFLYGAAAKAGAYAAKIGKFPTKAVSDKSGTHLMPRLEPLMLRVEDARDKRLALAAADRTLALHRFARAFLPRYAARKAQSGWLDFDDLITRSAALLSDRAVANWVLFRLDGGLDHILVDEAQDTSPAQWQVIERLAEEFTAGEGARGPERTIFVVGDMKQSIYSFQGADLRAFEDMRAHFRAKYDALATPFQELLLTHSFRSSAAILKVVDLAFDERVNRGLGGGLKHIAFKSDLPGRVDLWSAIPPTDKPEDRDWFDPVDILPGDHETMVLARHIATQIRTMIDTGVQVPTRDGVKAVDEGDILILVQRRSDLFHEIIRACKAANLAVAGADRLKLGAELAVRDIAALLNFLATPEDDLSLAATLRSPLFGWNEAQLYDLAHGRADKTYLWTALRERTTEFAETLAVLNDLRRQADFLRPFDLIERMLTRHDGRRRLIGRLGAEAEDGIDALLAQALSFEQVEIPSLTGFLVWMETDDLEIKRRLDSASKSIRVMTIHGAKGLEAPIVILPDTAKRRDDVKDEIYRIDGLPVWRTKVDESPARIASARSEMQDKQTQERMRLLYVAMTRAEAWLITCGAGDVGQGAESWYSIVDEALTKAGAETAGPFEFGPGKRFSHGDWPTNALPTAPNAASRTLTPDWARRDAPAAPDTVTVLSPSGLGGAKALPGDSGRDEDSAKRRGTHLHLLLEHLPLWPTNEWPRIADALLLDGEDPAEPAEIEPLLTEASQVLSSADMAPLLVPGALAEVELTARLDVLGGCIMHGTIDRLVVTETHVLAVDYKSNALVPDRPELVPDGLLRQMGAYAAMLEAIYPDKHVETAILWTRTGQLMRLDRDIVRLALQSTTIP